MTPNAAGAVQEHHELASNWHESLSPEQLAAYLRYQYVRHYEQEWDWDAPVHNRHRAQWDGGRDSYGVQHKAVWNRIAKAVRDRNADPGLWVCAHFSGVSYVKQVAQTHSIPDMRPNRLCAATSPGIYTEYLSHLPDIFSRGFEVAGQTIANRVRGTNALNLSEDDQLFYVLCDEAYVSASPFFRHAFAAQLGCERAVERYLWHAALDYEAQQRVYDQVVEPWCITEPLRAATIQIRNHWREFA
jgi:hypothetical protein